MPITSFIRPEKSLAVEVDHVIGGVGYPNFGFPGNIWKVLNHGLSIEERS